MNVDGNTIATIAAALTVIGTVFYAVRKVTAAELGIADARKKVEEATPKIRALEDRVLLLETNTANHAKSDEHALGEIRLDLKGLRDCFDELRADVADVAAAVRAGRGRESKDPRST